MSNPIWNPMTMRETRMHSRFPSKPTRPPAQAGAEAIAVVLVSILGAAFCLSCVTGPAPGPFPTPFEIIAHRGASAYAPENTIPAFEKASEFGVVDVELDIQLSKDDRVILFHDTMLAEKTGHPGKVRDHLAADLLDMEIGSWFDRTHPEVERSFAGTKLTTLAALFERFDDRFFYHIELKSSDLDLAQVAIEQVEAYGLGNNVRLTSFILQQVERAHALAPEIPTGLLVRDAARLRRDAGVADDATMLPLQRQKIDLAKASWRIRSDEDMHRAISLGVYGMTTNWPDRLIRALLEEKRSR